MQQLIAYMNQEILEPMYGLALSRRNSLQQKKGETRGAKTTRRRHVLNKSEKKNVVACISSTSNEEITLKNLSNAAIKASFSCY